jgi:hypothetical protein
MNSYIADLSLSLSIIYMVFLLICISLSMVFNFIKSFFYENLLHRL